jgi:hypothetical protein
MGHWLRYRHPSAARYERLGFGVESVAVETSRDRMLTLWVGWISCAR